jgi:surfeit locus 1 family protein
MLLGPRVREGMNGFHLITPLMRQGSSTVLVDRGFVSKDALDNAMCKREEGEVQVLGLLRTTHTRNNFTPDNNAVEGTWYWADVDAMAEYAGGEAANVQPIYVEEIFGGKGTLP